MKEAEGVKEFVSQKGRNLDRNLGICSWHDDSNGGDDLVVCGESSLNYNMPSFIN